MSTILHNDTAPLWVWILVIVIGSLIVISSIAVVWWLIRKRRRRRHADLDLETGTVPTRKLTVREGKVVPTQSTVSLTAPREERLSGDTAKHSTTGRDSFDWRASSKDTRQDGISPATPSVSSNQDSPLAARGGTTNSRPPRLSLGGFGDQEPLSNLDSAAELSAVSKPPTAVVTEPRKSRVINFSRPQLRPVSVATAPPKRNRLSVINESTPRNSFINRIVSWASTHHDDEPRQPEMKQVSGDDDSNSSAFGHSKKKSQQSGTADSSPVDEILRELHNLIEAPTPELPNRHPERTADASDDTTPSTQSRSSVVTDGQPWPDHTRHELGANFSRKRASSSPSVSRANSSAKLSQHRTANTLTHSRTSSNMSWLEQPQATLTGPFNAPISLTRPTSQESSWSEDTNPGIVAQSYGSYHNQHHRPQSSIATISSQAPTSISTDMQSTPNSRATAIPTHSRSASSTLEGNINVHVISISAAQGIQPKIPHTGNSNSISSPSPSPSSVLSPGPSHELDRSLSLSRSRSRSRGPIRTASKNGRQVLRKRSMQIPEITMIGPVDPTTLESLSHTRA